MRAFDGLVPGRHRQRPGRRPRSPRRGRARGKRPAGRGTAACPPVAFGGIEGVGEERGPRIARPELGMGQDGAQLLAVGRHAGDMELVERAGQAIDRRVERARGARLADQLGQQRIELRRRRQAEVAAGIDPHARPGRLAIGADRARALDDDARLDGKAARRAGRLLVGKAQRGERRAGRDPELRLDQVEAHDLLGDRVLDLDARIALDEEVFAGLGIDQELDRAGILVARRAGELDRIGQDAPAQALVEVGRRARSRRPSGCGAAPSSRARRDARGCPGCRPAPAPRCGAAAARSSPGTPRDRRTPPRPRSGSARRPRPSPRAPPPRACRARRRRPRPSASPGSRSTWPAPSPRRSTPGRPARRERRERPAPGRRRAPRPCRRTVSASPARVR